MKRRDREERHAEFFEVGQMDFVLREVALVDRHLAGDARLADHSRDLLVDRREPGLHVDDENCRRSLLEGGAHLFEDARLNGAAAVLVLEVHAARVDELEGLVLPDYRADEAVASHAALVVDDGDALAGDAVEDGGLADVGTSNDGDDPLPLGERKRSFGICPLFSHFLGASP